MSRTSPQTIGSRTALTKKKTEHEYYNKSGLFPRQHLHDNLNPVAHCSVATLAEYLYTVLTHGGYVLTIESVIQIRTNAR